MDKRLKSKSVTNRIGMMSFAPLLFAALVAALVIVPWHAANIPTNPGTNQSTEHSQGSGDDNSGDAGDQASQGTDTDTDGSAQGGSSSDESGDGADQDSAGNQNDTNFANYPYYTGTLRDYYGRIILTADAAGKQLKDGETYVVQAGTQLYLIASGRAGMVANNNLIYIERGAHLYCKGAFGQLQEPGLPGIALTYDRSLFITGEGKLDCVGGDAGNGSNGLNGGNGSYNDGAAGGDGEYYSGAGGRGGNGGGGAGAGIGTAGSDGGTGGAGGASVTGTQLPGARYQRDGLSGSTGSLSSMAAQPGHLCLAGNVEVKLVGGNRGNGGGGGWAGGSDIARHTYKYIAAGGGGGGGGAGGTQADAFGAGGTGGTGGSGGGSGGCVYRARGTSDDAPTGGGGAGAPNSSDWRGFENGGESGHGTRAHITDVIGGEGAGQGQAFPPPDTNVYSYLYMTRSMQGNLLSKQWDGTKLNQVAHTVDNYTGFAGVPSNGGWYVTNNLANQKGDGEPQAKFHSVISLTTAADLRDALTKKESIPTREGYTFLGWDMVYADGNSSVRIYDATTGTFNFQTLYDDKARVTTQGDTPEQCIWMTARSVTFNAVWQVKATLTYNVCYHANKSKFLDPTTGQEVGTDTYLVTGILSGTSIKLWDNASIGAYHISQPENAKNLKLVWATSVNKETGEPTSTVAYSGGYSFSRRVHKSGTTYNLYACWVPKGSHDQAQETDPMLEEEQEQTEATE